MISPPLPEIVRVPGAGAHLIGLGVVVSVHTRSPSTDTAMSCRCMFRFPGLERDRVARPIGPAQSSEGRRLPVGRQRSANLEPSTVHQPLANARRTVL